MLCRSGGAIARMLALSVGLAALLAGCAFAATSGDATPSAAAPTTPPPAPTTVTRAPTPTLLPPTPTQQATPSPAATLRQSTPERVATATPTPLLESLGLAAGASRLAAALSGAPPCSALRFQPATLPDGRSALIGTSADGGLVVELIGSDEGLVTASLVTLLPESDAAAQERARAAIYQLFGVAMPDRAWAIAWLDARIKDALEGIPFSATHEGHYVQLVRLRAPQPLIHAAVTTAPRTLSLPSLGPLDAPGAETVEPWNRLPVMPALLRGQRLPADGIELYEYTVNAPAQAVESFYAREMAGQGWRLVERALVSDPGSPEQTQLVLIYRRGAEGAIVSIERFAGLQATLVTLGYAEDAAQLPSVAG